MCEVKKYLKIIYTYILIFFFMLKFSGFMSIKHRLRNLANFLWK